MRSTLLAGVVLVTLAVATAGCGGGGSGSASEDTTADTTGQTTTSTPGKLEETDGSFSPDSPVCKEVTNQGSPLNIAASTGDFETAADRWAGLVSKVPASLRPDVENVVAGYRKIDEDPAGFGVLDTEPYKSSLAALNNWTATNCAS